MSTYVAEYAKSGRSKCKFCSSVIPEGTLRLGTVRDVGDYSQTTWYHIDCLPATKKLRTIAAKDFTGFTLLKKKDQGSVRKVLAALCAEEEEKTNSNNGGSGRPAKRSKSKKGKEAKWKGYTQSQHEEYAAFLISLQNKSMDFLKEACRVNGQKVTGTKSELIERVADGKVLGAIPKCTACGGGRLRFNAKTGIYTCPGYMEDQDFVRCSETFSQKSITREPWQE